MSIVVVTRMQAKDLSAVRTATGMTDAVLADLASCPGFLGGRVRIDRRKVLWTVTVWRDTESLGRFRELHQQVAARGPELAGDMHMSSWRQATDRIPTWRELRLRWAQVVPPALGLSRTLRAAAVAAAR